MNGDLESRISKRIARAKRGTLFFTGDFMTYGKPASVRRALRRLTQAGKFSTIDGRIYYRPKIDSVIGPLTPTIEEIVKVIAKRKGFRIAPTGYHALNAIGLSTQVVMHVIYLTDGNSKKLKIGNRTVKFIRTTPKNVSAKGSASHLVIQALRVIGKDNATAEEIKHIHHVLTFEKQENLKHDIKLAPIWIQKIMKPAIR